MSTVFKLAGAAGLGLTIVPAVLVALGQMTLDQNHRLMVIGMILWFISAPLQRRCQKR